MESLRGNRVLIDQRVNAIDVAEAKAWRSQQLEEILQRHAELSEALEKMEQKSFEKAMVWLGANEEQKDTLAKLLRTGERRDSHWSLKTPEVLTWIEQGRENVCLWLTGIPGAGKCLSTSIIYEVELSPYNTESLFIELSLLYLCGC